VPDLFPLAVERVFNQVVAEHALTVTFDDDLKIRRALAVARTNDFYRYE